MWNSRGVKKFKISAKIAEEKLELIMTSFEGLKWVNGGWRLQIGDRDLNPDCKVGLFIVLNLMNEKKIRIFEFGT